jgi:Zn-dependent protease
VELPPPEQLIPMIVVIFFAIGLHEYAHCKMADAAGDPTPGIQGRVTLNLTKHFEPMGTIMIILTSISGFGIGWGRPAPMDPRKMRNPRWDLFAAVAAGPISNLLQATFFGLWFRLLAKFSPDALQNQPLFFLLFYGITINLALCFFNLIPFGPLDGHWLVGQLLPEKQRYYWYRFNRNVGMIGLFVAIMILDLLAKQGGPDVLGVVLHRPIGYMFKLLTGFPIPI